MPLPLLLVPAGMASQHWHGQLAPTWHLDARAGCRPALLEVLSETETASASRLDHGSARLDSDGLEAVRLEPARLAGLRREPA